MIRILLAASIIVMSVLPASAQRWDRRGGWDRHHDRGDDVGRVLGGIIGGVIIGATRPRYYEPPPVYTDPIAYCIQRFRSYNPKTGYYLGFDGQYRRCP